MKSWIKICPDVAEIWHDASQSWQVFDEAGRRQILANFRPGIIVDFDHGSTKRSDSPPAGRILELRNRGAEGLWARVAWTEPGAEAVAGKRYAYLSPRLHSEPCDGGKYRPIRLDSVALTNRPGLPELTIQNSVMTNDDSTTQRDDFLTGGSLPLPGVMNHKAELCKFLGIAPTASKTEIRQAILECRVAGLRNRNGSPAWYDAGVDARLELTALLQLDINATDENINEALHRPRHAPLDERSALLQLLRLPQSADDDAIKDTLDDLQHSVRNSERHAQWKKMRLNNMNTEKGFWGQWDQGLPRLLRPHREGSNPLRRMANTLAATRSPRQLRALASNYPQGGEMRELLTNLADEADQKSK